MRPITLALAAGALLVPAAALAQYGYGQSYQQGYRGDDRYRCMGIGCTDPRWRDERRYRDGRRGYPDYGYRYPGYRYPDYGYRYPEYRQPPYRYPDYGYRYPDYRYPGYGYGRYPGDRYRYRDNRRSGYSVGVTIGSGGYYGGGVGYRGGPWVWGW